MDEASNNVFARSAFASNKDGNVGGSYFDEPRTKRLHGFRSAKNDVIRGNLAQRLRQCGYRKCRHKSEYPVAVE